MKKKLINKIIQLLKANTTPREIARGLAIGVFVGVTPLIGFHALLGIGLAYLFRANKPAAVVGTQVSLPWFQPFLFFFNLQIGTLILSGKWQLPHINLLSLQSIESNLPAFLLGTLIVGSLGALLTYYLSLKAAQRIDRKLKKIIPYY